MSKGLRIAAGLGLIAAAIFFPAALPFLLPLGASLALGAVLEPKPARIDRLQSQNVLVRSAVTPQEIVYGMTRKSGVLVWYGTSGATNEYLWFVVAVCEHEIESYESLWIDEVEIDVATEIDGSGYVTNAAFVDADSSNLVKTGLYTGESVQTADAELVAAFPDWDADHYGNDVAYFWVRLELDTSEGGTDPENPNANVWNKGFPRDISTTIKGAKVYDPRLDDLNGGTGSHRVGTSSTWEWSDNSVLCRADYLRSERFGPGYTSGEVDWTVVATQADIADESVEVETGVYQTRYTLNGIVTVSDSPKAIIEDMQSADHGNTLFLPDGVQILVGAWVASSHTIDNTWLAGAFNASSAESTDSAYNAVRGQYMSADQGFSLVEFIPRTSSAYETEDGVGRVWRDIVLPFSDEEYRSQRMAIIELKKSRQQTTAKMRCNYRGELVQVFDVITLDLPGFTGLDESPTNPDTFRVLGKASSTDGTVTLELREEVESDWTYTLPDLAEPPIIPSVDRDNNGPLPPTTLTAVTAVNGILVEWTNSSMIAVSHIEVYGSATNNRSTAALLTKTRSEQYLHQLNEGDVRYYWVLARSESGLVSTWEPVGATSGVTGTAGGAEVVRYYIKPTAGTALQNGLGQLTVEAHETVGGVDTHLSTGTIKLYIGIGSPLVYEEVTVANGYQTGSDGYTGVLDATNIDGSVIVEMKDGPTGETLDTISLVDIADGGDSVAGYIEADPTLSWVREPDESTYVPSDLSTQLNVTFVQGGVDVARRGIGVLRFQDDKLLNSGYETHPDGDLNPTRITRTVSGELSHAMTVNAIYTNEESPQSVLSTVSETVTISLSGSHGDDAERYYIKPIDGTSIKNGTGTLEIQAHETVGGVDTHLSTGTIKLYTDLGSPLTSTEVTVANGFQAGSDGYSGFLDATNIDDSIIVEMKDGPSGQVLDTISLVDIADGGSGIYGYIESSAGLAWVRDPDGTTWTPSDTSTVLGVTFVQNGQAVAREAVQITRSAGGILAGPFSATHPDGDLNTSRVTFVALDNLSQALTGKFTYTYAGETVVIYETLTTSLSGGDGDNGQDGINSNLTNDNVTVVAAADGTGYSLTGTGGTHQVISGDTDVTTSAVHSIVGGTDGGANWTKTQNGLTLTVVEATGVYTLSGASWTSDEEAFTLRAVYSGLDLDRTYNISKALAGAGDPSDQLALLKGGYNFATDTSSATSTWGLRTTGQEYFQDNGGTKTTIGTWLNSGSAGDYSAMVQYTSGDALNFGDSTNTWYALSTERYWGNTSSSGARETVFFAQIKRNSDDIIVASTQVTVRAFQSL